MRRLGRALRDEVLQAVEYFQVEGNLSKSYLVDNPKAQFDELIWGSDFQTFTDNPAIPENVRIWLIPNYNKRFGANK